ncbi:MAG TPA: anti-sigma factor [Terriglobales bacterium]
MKDHAEFAEDLALYAMGALDARDRPELEAHLGTCSECRRELEALRSDLALVALSVTGPQPPQRSRERLMSALARETERARERPQQPRPQLVSARQHSRWFTLTPIAAALALACLSIGLMVQVQRIKTANAQLEQALANEKQKYTTAKAVMDMLNNPNVQRMTLVSTSTLPTPQVKTYYQKKDGHVLLLATNLHSLPTDKSYQLWLIPMGGGAPMPAGIFRVEPDGSTMMMHTMETTGVEAKAFAITVEPLHGSPTPTMPIVMAPAS